MELLEVEKTIIKRLNSYSRKTLLPNQKVLGNDCTSSIKNIIGDYGLELGFGVCASGNPKFEYEWLYDLVWYSTNEKGFNGLELALESELCRDLGQIKYDFDKLLIANARYRIMICMSMSFGAGVKEIKKQCRDAIENYDLLPSGARFLVLIWDDYDTGKFLPYPIVKSKSI